MEQPQTISEGVIRHLATELANTHIALASRNAQMDALLMSSRAIQGDLWEQLPPVDREEGEELVGSEDIQWVVPQAQVDAVMRLVAGLNAMT